MGDSDEEYDRRRARDKFRRERSDYNDRRRERDDRGGSRREDWSDRRRDQGTWDQRRRGDYRDFERGRRDSSGRMSPPMPKRMRRDWDEPFHAEGNFPYGGGANNTGSSIHHGSWNHPGDVQQQIQIGGQDARQQLRPDGPPPDVPSGPTMLSFKQFLNAQDDDIDDMEAVRKYQDYKLEFRKTQLGDFFQQHKEEQWFRAKYHPKEAAIRNKEMQKAVKKRVAVFLELMKSGHADTILLDMDHADNLVKLLDAVVIKLEGGSDFDLTILDRAPSPERKGNVSHEEEKEASSSDSKRERTKRRTRSRSSSPSKSKDKKDSGINPVSPSSVPLPDAPPPPSSTPNTQPDPKPLTMPDPTPEQKQLQQQAQFYHQQRQFYQQQISATPETPEQQKQQEQPEQKPTEGKDEAGGKKRKHRHREPYYYDAMEDESESESDSESDSEPAPPGEEMSSNEVKGGEELLPPGVEAEAAPAADDELKPPGVDDSSVADATIQLPTSSSGVEKDDKPDSGADSAVGSSETVSVSSQDKAKPAKTVPVTSDDSVIDSTQSPDTKPQSDSPDQSEESIKRGTGDAQVGSSTVSSDLAVSSAKDNEDVDMAPASSSDVVRKSSVDGEAESNTDVEMPTTPVTPQNQVQKEEEMDSNILAEKKEVKEEESPIQPSPAKESKENTIEEKEKDSAEDAEEGKDKPLEASKEMVPLTPEPKPLHKTYSLFMRNIPPNISKGDIAAICKRFTGFLRVALSDPSPDRRFYRRGWITFERSVNIKEICWDLNNVRIKDAELNPVVNRDLSRRVRTVSGLTFAKQVIRQDIKLAAQMIRILDKKSSVYEKEKKVEETNGKEKDSEKKEEREEGEERAEEKEANFNLPDKNPIIASLSEDATEEEEGEEMELLGTSSAATQDSTVEKSEVDLAIDENLLRVLDRLVLYLRVVHSLDYYNGGDYPHEDEMPNRCGIIHVRGSVPEKATQTEVQEWQKTLKQKLEPYMQERGSISDEEVAKLGKKDPESEIEKFVEANSQELAKDKWLCPLSGKKFRGPDFVKKHIFNKHAEKVEAVKLEAEFFNRYLTDPRRPQNPEVMQKQAGPQGPIGGQMFGQQHDGGQGMMGWGPRPHMMMYGPRGPYTPPSFGGGFGPEGYGRGAGHTFPPKPRRFGDAAGRFRQQERGFHRDPRQIVQYRDLDAPEDTDVF